MIKKIILLLLLGISYNLKSQELAITLLNNTTQSFPLSTVKSLKFLSGNMILKQNDGTIYSWSIPSILNYTFLTLGDNDYIVNDKINLKVYPNPSNGVVNFKFYSINNENIKIEIVDINGRIISEIFNGNHTGDRTYQWINNVEKGIYYCKIITDDAIISKPIIIN
jgi:hypothetical protein